MKLAQKQAHKKWQFNINYPEAPSVNWHLQDYNSSSVGKTATQLTQSAKCALKEV